MAGSVAGGRDFRAKLASAWAGSGSMLCVGLDPDPARFPAHLRGRPRAVLEFCTAIADATAPFVCAFKPQIAYFASLGAEEQLSAVMDHLRTHHPRIPVILDAKRGDIGSTAEHYAREVFERYAADAVTVSPYLGGDAIAPYLAYPGRGVLVLCRTSNPGGADLQSLPVHAPVPAHAPVQAHPEPEADGAELSSMGVAGEPMPLYAYVAQLAATCWNAEGQIGLVVGATYPQELRRVRQLAPDALQVLVCPRVRVLGRVHGRAGRPHQEAHHELLLFYWGVCVLVCVCTCVRETWGMGQGPTGAIFRWSRYPQV